MPTTRTYADSCGIGRALDVVGERWALLVVRELLLGPQRFTDLRRALPGASSNLLADRLRELHERGVVARRTLPPPGAAKVYELTDWGRELEPIVLALGAWGLRVPAPEPSTLSATSILIYLRGSLDPGHRTFRVELDDRVWTVSSRDGETVVTQGQPEHADGSVRTDPRTLNELIDDPAALPDLVAAGRAETHGAIGYLFTSRRSP
ncbi:winged helix-turn-helix transcriptional regulator [Virgisporangium ochraceum]|uniref:HxlR family transcriptional regulator n=1 Tax=Virgisporangium ochraceum TaxID=65505 RepID=A0A8J3ZUN2_9ACTN|nr:helix-turn-helix domain-containing protein [Virgisporangium ochraceum]GIJ68408.1 HxlR family transcriptional regulator [Virgisporangium ochraceum]